MSSRPKQSMSELKLRRLLEHNQRLREDLGRPRIRVSEASASLIRYCKTTTDHLVSPLRLSTPISFHFHSPLYPYSYRLTVSRFHLYGVLLAKMTIRMPRRPAVGVVLYNRMLFLFRIGRPLLPCPSGNRTPTKVAIHIYIPGYHRIHTCSTVQPLHIHVSHTHVHGPFFLLFDRFALYLSIAPQPFLSLHYRFTFPAFLAYHLQPSSMCFSRLLP